MTLATNLRVFSTLVNLFAGSASPPNRGKTEARAARVKKNRRLHVGSRGTRIVSDFSDVSREPGDNSDLRVNYVHSRSAG